jgi:hypothetical protein
MSSASVRFPDTHRAKSLTDMLQTKLRTPATSLEYDFHGAVDQVLADVGLTARDSGGKLTFYGRDPIVPSSFKFGAMAAVNDVVGSVDAPQPGGPVSPSERTFQGGPREARATSRQRRRRLRGHCSREVTSQL